MLLRIETYEQSIVNHKSARQCFKQFADANHPARVLWLDGASEMGKSYLLDWFARNIEDCHPKLFCLQDHASIQYVLWELANTLRDAGLPTKAFDSAEKPLFSPSRNEISDIRIEGDNNHVGINLSHSQSGNEILISYRMQLRALVLDMKSAAATGDMPHYVLMFDQMDRCDLATKDFIYRLFTRELFPISSFQFIFSGKGVADEIRKIPDPKIRSNSLNVTLTPFTNAEDIATYLKLNGNRLTTGHDLHALADTILRECKGMPNMVGVVMKVFCEEPDT